MTGCRGSAAPAEAEKLSSARMREANHKLWRIEIGDRRSEGEKETERGEFVGYVLLLHEERRGAEMCKGGEWETRKEEWATLDEAMAGLVVFHAEERDELYGRMES